MILIRLVWLYSKNEMYDAVMATCDAHHMQARFRQFVQCKSWPGFFHFPKLDGWTHSSQSSFKSIFYALDFYVMWLFGLSQVSEIGWLVFCLRNVNVTLCFISFHKKTPNKMFRNMIGTFSARLNYVINMKQTKGIRTKWIKSVIAWNAHVRCSFFLPSS